MWRRLTVSTPDTAAERRTTYREVLAHRAFAAMLSAWLISMLGNVLADVALSYLVYERTASTFAASVAFSIGWLPNLFVGTALAGLPDRVPARRLMVGCDLACAGVTALLAVPGTPIPVLLLLVVLLGCFTPVFGAARASTLPDLLLGDQYVVGQALLSVIGQSSQLLGYAVGAGVLSLVGPRPALLVDAVSFVGSAVIVRLGTPLLVPHHRDGAGSLARESLRGVRTLLGIARVRSLMVLGWVAPMLGVIPESLAVPYSSRHGAGATGAALMLGATAAGVIVGELVVARAFLPSSRVKAMAPLALWISLPPLVFVLHPSVPAAAGLMLLSGVGWAYGLAQSQLLLEAMPEPLRRRGLSTSTSGMMLTQALGFFAGGALAEWLAPQDVIAIGGLTGLVVVSLLLLAVRRSAR